MFFFVFLIVGMVGECGQQLQESTVTHHWARCADSRAPRLRLPRPQIEEHFARLIQRACPKSYAQASSGAWFAAPMPGGAVLPQNEGATAAPAGDGRLSRHP